MHQILPTPQEKQNIIKAYAKKFGTEIFLETGTFLGETVLAVMDDFRAIYSIELGQDLYLRAQQMFSNLPHITILNGDSGVLLQQIMPQVNDPYLFWLDAHYSSGITARGDRDTPILQELYAILCHPIKDHVILIDDARLFGEDEEYPTVDEIRALIQETNKKYKNSYEFSLETDVMRITNPSGISDHKI